MKITFTLKNHPSVVKEFYSSDSDSDSDSDNFTMDQLLSFINWCNDWITEYKKSISENST